MFSEALDEYIWCFNHGLENNPAYAGVRLSFLLARIVSLGKDYPAAQQFLRERTDSVEQELISLYPKGTAEIANLRQEAMDYTALCRCLNQKKRLLETYDLLKSRPRTVEVRKLLLRDLIDKLLAARRYQDICETGNGLETIEQSIQSYQFTQSQFKERKGGMGDPTAYMKERVRVDGGKYYEAAVGASNLAEASAIVERLLDFDPSLATFENLANHALRAKRKDEAEKLVERAAQRLPAEQLASLRELVSDEDSTGSSDGDGN
jgi:tetratricopeptide (TPR) repeat protein